jgi:membrane protein implicated in regulation of membrane protease activity
MTVVAWLAAGFTVVKWLFVYGSFLILSVVVLAAIWKWLRSRSE